MCDCLVPLAEVAKETKQTVSRAKAECQKLGLPVRPDWAGRYSISADDAAALVSGQARREQKHAEAVMDHMRAVEEWKAARDAAVKTGADEGQRKAEHKAMRRGYLRGAGGPLSPGGISAARRDGAIFAGEQFERRSPRPDLNRNRDYVKLAYVTPDEEGSLIASTVGALRGAVKKKAPSMEVD